MKISHRLRNRILAEFNQFRVFKFQDPVQPECKCIVKHETLSTMIKKDIVIIYSKGTIELASIQMRLLQVAKFILYLNPDIKIIALSQRPSNLIGLKNKLIILSKFASELISRSELATLTRNGNMIYVDPVDSKCEVSKFHSNCTLVASSIEQARYFKNSARIDSKLIYHSSDLRLKWIKAEKNEFSIGYFGNLSRIPKEYNDLTKLNIIKTPLSFEPRRELPRYAAKLRKYSAHLVTGTNPVDQVFKPFTKGIVASHVGALPLISEIDVEGLSLLGRDYPYIAKNNRTNSISEMIEYMQTSFKSKEWLSAEELNKNLEPYYCEVNITNMWQQLFQ
jgi:hypothetical protein